MYVKLDGTSYAVSRLIWKWMTGNDPIEIIDHADLNPLNNSWGNLREADQAQNRANTGVRRQGLKGAYKASGSKRWLASVGKKYIGYYDTEQEAHDAYVAEAKRQYQQFHRPR